jgi:hypothetical protein
VGFAKYPFFMGPLKVGFVGSGCSFAAAFSRSVSDTPYVMLEPSGLSQEIVSNGSAIELVESKLARTPAHRTTKNLSFIENPPNRSFA